MSAVPAFIETEPGNGTRTALTSHAHPRTNTTIPASAVLVPHPTATFRRAGGCPLPLSATGRTRARISCTGVYGPTEREIISGELLCSRNRRAAKVARAWRVLRSDLRGAVNSAALGYG